MQSRPKRNCTSDLNPNGLQRFLSRCLGFGPAGFRCRRDFGLGCRAHLPLFRGLCRLRCFYLRPPGLLSRRNPGPSGSAHSALLRCLGRYWSRTNLPPNFTRLSTTDYNGVGNIDFNRGHQPPCGMPCSMAQSSAARSAPVGLTPNIRAASDWRIPAPNRFFFRCWPSVVGSFAIGKLRVQTGATSFGVPAYDHFPAVFGIPGLFQNRPVVRVEMVADLFVNTIVAKK